MTISTSIIESESLQPKKTSLSYVTETQLKAEDSVKTIFFTNNGKGFFDSR